MSIDIFTEYDDSIAAEVLRDPLGMQVIWSDLGQRIFQYRLTSLSDDIRNFTINLFHHHTIRSLLEQNKLPLTDKQKAYFHSNSSLKMGLVLFLENLLVYCLFDLDERSGQKVRLEGLLGSFNARTRWRTENRNPLISTNPKHELLVRQVSLGINGRYKTPFMQMGILNQDYSYPPNTDIWKEIERLFSGGDKWTTTLNNLKSAVDGIIYKACLVKTSSPHIELRYRDCLKSASKHDLLDLYHNTFGSSDLMPAKVKKFLVMQMGLNEGAARALYSALAKNASFMTDIDYEAIFRAALREEMPDQQKQLIKDIIQVEPHLSRLNYIFRRICSPETYFIDDLQNDADTLIKISAEESRNIEDMRFRIARENTTSSNRLRRISDVLISNNTESFITNLYEYHREIMNFRNLPAWFSIRNKQISHGMKMNISSDDSFDYHHPVWIHDYYLNTLISLQRGIERA